MVSSEGTETSTFGLVVFYTVSYPVIELSLELSDFMNCLISKSLSLASFLAILLSPILFCFLFWVSLISSLLEVAGPEKIGTKLAF